MLSSLPLDTYVHVAKSRRSRGEENGAMSPRLPPSEGRGKVPS